MVSMALSWEMHIYVFHSFISLYDCHYSFFQLLSDIPAHINAESGNECYHLAVRVRTPFSYYCTRRAFRKDTRLKYGQESVVTGSNTSTGRR